MYKKQQPFRLVDFSHTERQLFSIHQVAPCFALFSWSLSYTDFVVVVVILLHDSQTLTHTASITLRLEEQRLDDIRYHSNIFLHSYNSIFSFILTVKGDFYLPILNIIQKSMLLYTLLTLSYTHKYTQELLTRR